MTRNTLMLVLAGCVVVLAGVLLLTQRDIPGPTVASDEGTRIEAPGTRVDSNSDSTRIQAPGVDITVPRDKDGD